MAIHRAGAETRRRRWSLVMLLLVAWLGLAAAAKTKPKAKQQAPKKVSRPWGWSGSVVGCVDGLIDRSIASIP
jgi:hypothetical protein